MLRILVAALAPLVVSACSQTPLPVVVPFASPLNVDAGIRPPSYRSPLNGFSARQPVNPKPWRQLNDEQGPAKGSQS